METSKRTKKLVDARSGGRCEICALPAPKGNRNYCHRRPRGSGGSVDPLSDSPANIFLGHPSCHQHSESNRTMSLRAGWLVHQSIDPSKIPFLYGGRGWVMLGTGGEATPTSPPTVR